MNTNQKLGTRNSEPQSSIMLLCQETYDAILVNF